MVDFNLDLLLSDQALSMIRAGQELVGSVSLSTFYLKIKDVLGARS